MDAEYSRRKFLLSAAAVGMVGAAGITSGQRILTYWNRSRLRNQARKPQLDSQFEAARSRYRFFNRKLKGLNHKLIVERRLEHATPGGVARLVLASVQPGMDENTVLEIYARILNTLDSDVLLNEYQIVIDFEVLSFLVLAAASCASNIDQVIRDYRTVIYNDSGYSLATNREHFPSWISATHLVAAAAETGRPIVHLMECYMRIKGPFRPSCFAPVDNMDSEAAVLLTIAAARKAGNDGSIDESSEAIVKAYDEILAEKRGDFVGRDGDSFLDIVPALFSVIVLQLRGWPSPMLINDEAAANLVLAATYLPGDLLASLDDISPVYDQVLDELYHGGMVGRRVDCPSASRLVLAAVQADDQPIGNLIDAYVAASSEDMGFPEAADYQRFAGISQLVHAAAILRQEPTGQHARDRPT